MIYLATLAPLAHRATPNRETRSDYYECTARKRHLWNVAERSLHRGRSLN
jgi:hypothetical protein